MGLTQTDIRVPAVYTVGEGMYNYSAHEIMRPVFYAFNSQLQNAKKLRLPYKQEETILALKKAYFGDPAKRWYAPQGEADCLALLAKYPDVQPNPGEDDFWEMEQNQNWFWSSSLFVSEHEWVSLGNASDTRFHVVHIPTKRVWHITPHR